MALFGFVVVNVVFSLLNGLVTARAGKGYDYSNPLALSEHLFDPLPTLLPLPPIPSLPPLPTPRSNTKIVSQSLLQTHPPSKEKTTAVSYLTPTAAVITQITQQYAGATADPSLSTLSTYNPAISIMSTSTAIRSRDEPSTAPGSEKLLEQPTASSAPADQGAQGAQRVIYRPGNQLEVVQYPSSAAAATAAALGNNDDIYEINGRQLKQYSVMEIIDNDIEEDQQPLDMNSYRARLPGPTPTAIQLPSFAHMAVAEQQRLALQRINRPIDSIALGSGGLGFVRLPNGSIHLGSGSLGYISSQQRLEAMLAARNANLIMLPDALHFGRGPWRSLNTIN